jgi:hypothetical protein
MAGNGWHRQEMAIAALLQSSSIQEASEVCGVSTRTFSRYLQNAGFKARLQGAKLQLLEGAVNKLRLSARDAVEVLVGIAHDGLAPSSARVAAARSIVSLAIEAAEVADIRARLQALEQKTLDADASWSSAP